MMPTAPVLEQGHKRYLGFFLVLLTERSVSRNTFSKSLTL
jgi:hypothetical protein